MDEPTPDAPPAEPQDAPEPADRGPDTAGAAAGDPRAEAGGAASRRARLLTKLAELLDDDVHIYPLF